MAKIKTLKQYADPNHIESLENLVREYRNGLYETVIVITVGSNDDRDITTHGFSKMPSDYVIGIIEKSKHSIIENDLEN